MSASNDPSRWVQGRGPYIRTASGNQFFFLQPRVEEMHLNDIIHHMARIRRYTGATEYTNGQHSIVGARMAAMFYPDNALLPARFLIHDMAETYIGDVSSPLKCLLPDYKRIETEVDACVEKKFDLTFVGDPLVKELDDRMWLTERLAIYPMLTQKDDYHGALEPFPLELDDFEENFYPWATEVVEHEFRIALHHHLPWMF